MNAKLPIPARSPTSTLLADRKESVDELLADVRVLTERHSFVTAARRFGALFRLIEEHVDTEEHVWLPRIVERWPDRAPIVDHARADHRLLRRQMVQVADALSAWRHHDAIDALDRLRDGLAAHHAHEDTELYPAVLALKLAAGH